MTPHFALKVAAAQLAALEKRATALAVADSIIRALVDANAERDAALRLYSSEISRLTFANATLAEDNALMVEAVALGGYGIVARRPVERVH